LAGAAVEAARRADHGVGLNWAAATRAEQFAWRAGLGLLQKVIEFRNGCRLGYRNIDDSPTLALGPLAGMLLTRLEPATAGATVHDDRHESLLRNRERPSYEIGATKAIILTRLPGYSAANNTFTAFTNARAFDPFLMPNSLSESSVMTELIVTGPFTFNVT
jgi:hypothetical protein